jgi:hypothetical protein
MTSRTTWIGEPSFPRKVLTPTIGMPPFAFFA